MSEEMDNWQKHIYDDCTAFVGEEFEHRPDDVTLGISKREAYVIIKALEDQQRYLHPILRVQDKETQ